MIRKEEILEQRNAQYGDYERLMSLVSKVKNYIRIFDCALYVSGLKAEEFRAYEDTKEFTRLILAIKICRYEATNDRGLKDECIIDLLNYKNLFEMNYRAIVNFDKGIFVRILSKDTTKLQARDFVNLNKLTFKANWRKEDRE